jgi:hypothetical protein
MKIDQLVRDTLADHAHLAPGAEEILLDLHRRIERPRTGGWPLTIAAAAVLVAGTGIGVVALRGPQHQTGTAANHPNHSISAASSSVARPLPAGPQIAPVTMPFDLGWLPAGDQQYLARRINIGALSDTSPAVFDGEYMLNIHGADGDFFVDVRQMPGDVSHIRFKSGPGRATTVNGWPAIESSNSGTPGGYEIYYQDSAGGTMYVNVAGADGQRLPASTVVTAGRRVAAGVRLPGTTRVNPTFGVGYVPAGLKVVTFDVESSPGYATSYQLGEPTSQTPAVQITSPSRNTPLPGPAGRTVQGHRTRYNTDRGYTELYVLNAIKGSNLMIGSTLPLNELYRIADGLVLPR